MAVFSLCFFQSRGFSAKQSVLVLHHAVVRAIVIRVCCHAMARAR